MADRTRISRDLWGCALKEGCADGERMAQEAARSGAGGHDPHAMDAIKTDLYRGTLHAAALGRGRELARLAGLGLDTQQAQRDRYAADYAQAVWGRFVSASSDLARAARLARSIARAEAQEMATAIAIEFGLATDSPADQAWLN